MYKEERFDGKIKSQISDAKLNMDPYKVYVKQREPKEGVEVLFDETINEGKALVNPNGFPWMNLSLDPLGTIMTKNQHHNIKNSGFGLVVSILEFLFEKYGDLAIAKAARQADVKYDGKECFKVIFTNNDFAYIKYTVNKGENLITIAEKFKLSEYMILEKNKKMDDYFDVVEGDVILIPNDYCPKMELLIDKQNMIPLSIKVFDDQGLYESFKYTNVVLNPKFSDLEFTKDNEPYGF